MDFEIFEIEFSAQEFKIEIEFEVLRSRFRIFREPKFIKSQNFIKILVLVSRFLIFPKPNNFWFLEEKKNLKIFKFWQSQDTKFY